jgi:hypothetical protein
MNDSSVPRLSAVSYDKKYFTGDILANNSDKITCFYYNIKMTNCYFLVPGNNNTFGSSTTPVYYISSLNTQAY